MTPLKQSRYAILELPAQRHRMQSLCQLSRSSKLSTFIHTNTIGAHLCCSWIFLSFRPSGVYLTYMLEHCSQRSHLTLNMLGLTLVASRWGQRGSWPFGDSSIASNLASPWHRFENWLVQSVNIKSKRNEPILDAFIDELEISLPEVSRHLFILQSTQSKSSWRITNAYLPAGKASNRNNHLVE